MKMRLSAIIDDPGAVPTDRSVGHAEASDQSIRSAKAPAVLVWGGSQRQRRTSYIAGAAPLDENKQVVGDDRRLQTDVCFGKITKIVGEAGGAMSDMAFVTTYLSGIDEILPVNQAHFGVASGGRCWAAPGDRDG